LSRRIFSARIVLLDWDGTLLNSYDADKRSYLAMFRALEVGWGVAELQRNYSPDWYHVYRAAGIPRTKWLRANRLWRAAYRAERPRLLPGARSVLRALRSAFTLAVVTSGSRDRVRKQIRDFGFTDDFSACVYSEDTLRKKPYPDPLQLALKRLRATPEECVYVGDAPQDVEMARRAGVRVIGVLGPFPTADSIRATKPDLLLGSIRELPEHLRLLD
jgi:HAD superfamily hydrolase (TIGR01509 family)